MRQPIRDGGELKDNIGETWRTTYEIVSIDAIYLSDTMELGETPSHCLAESKLCEFRGL